MIKCKRKCRPRSVLPENVILCVISLFFFWILFLEYGNFKIADSLYKNGFSGINGSRILSNVTEEIIYENDEEETHTGGYDESQEEEEVEEGGVDPRVLGLGGWGNLTYWQSSVELADPHVQTPGRARRLPTALIIGVKKAGTESLAHFLTIHPKIKYPQREIHFFDKDKKYGHGLSYYRKKMPLSSPDQLTIEKTPNYFDSPDAVWRIHKFNSSIKLILIVRDPIQRLISDYTHNYHHPGKNDRIEHWVPFENMVFHENGSVKASYVPVHRSIYHLHYSQYLRYFHRNQILVLDGEKFMKNPYQTCKQVEAFLGLPPYIEEEHFVFNQKKNFFCKRVHGKTICMGRNKGRKHKKVSDGAVQKLVEFFRPHNRIFENMLNYTFSWP